MTAVGRNLVIHRVGWRWFAAAAVLTVVIGLDIRALDDCLTHWRLTGGGVDWRTYTHAISGNPYTDPLFRFSPVAAWLLAPIVAGGLVAWQLAHLVALALARDWKIVLLIVLSAPFWFDLEQGNILIFVLVAAWVAVRSERVATALPFLALAVLAPRPLMLPMLIWLLWHRPRLRLPFLAIFVAHTGLTLLSGYGGEWVSRLMTSTSEMTHPSNIGPSRLIGAVWIPLGLAVATYLTLRGRLGLASLAAQPYIFHYYLLMLVLELRQDQPVANARQDVEVARRAGLGAGHFPLELGSGAGRGDRQRARVTPGGR